MAEREAEEVVEKGGISRRKLLRLAAYSVPTMSLVNMAASSRALATTPGPCSFPCRVRTCCETEIGYKAKCCPGPEHAYFHPDHCDEYISTGEVGKGFVFVNCKNESLWHPTPGQCYSWTPCSTAGEDECWQVHLCGDR